MNDTVRISVVVPTTDQATDLARSLDALAAQTAPADAYEIVIVDNASTDATQEIVSAFGRRLQAGPRRLLEVDYRYHPTRLGLAAARNRGIRESRGEIIAFTLPGCLPAPDWIERLLVAWQMADEGTEAIGAIGGRTVLLLPEGASFADSYTQLHQWRELPKVENGRVRYLLNTNASYRYDALRTVAGFDESFPCGGGEDADLGRRIAEAGYSLRFDPTVVVYQEGRRTIRGLIHQAYRYGRSAAHHEAKLGQLDKPERALGTGVARLGLSPLRAVMYRREVGLPFGKSIGMAVVDGLVAVAAASGRVAEAIDRLADEEPKNETKDVSDGPPPARR